MALQDSDLLVVQQGNNIYKLSTSSLSTKVRGDISPTDLPIASGATLGGIRVGNNLTIDSNTGVLDAVIPAGFTFKGQIQATDSAPTATPGDLYLFSTAGTLDGTWGAAAGTNVQINDGIVFEASGEWDHLPGLFGAGVTTITGTLPIEVGGSASNPVISINPATDTTAGSMSASDKDKLDNIKPGSDIGTVTEVTVVSDSGLTVLKNTTTPEIGLLKATPTTQGAVVMADVSALVAGTKGAVVDAEQYKLHTERLDVLEAAPPIVVQESAGSAIGVVENPVGTFTVDVSVASESTKGVIQIATAAEVEAGVVTDKVVTPQEVASFYVPQDFSSLGDLP